MIVSGAARALRRVAICVLAACAKSPDASPPHDSAGGSVTDTAQWTTVRWHPHVAPVADHGRGVVIFEPRDGAIPRTDTLLVRQRPDAGAPAVAAILVRTDTGSSSEGWRYAAAAPALAAPNLVEYGYEEAGVTYDSVSGDSAWVRARVGTDSVGRWITGWVAIAGIVERRDWTTALAEQMLFFLDSSAARLAASPGGAALPMPEGEAALYGTGRRSGRWLEVRVVSPSDYCSGPDSVRRTERRAWIEYLDAAGRPRVWYHSRGC